MDHKRAKSESARDDEDRPNRPFCAVCGDVKACFHKPDAVVRAAWVRETYRNVREEK